MLTLSIDIETYSSNDIRKGGVYKYVEAADFTILLFAYTFEGAPRVIDIAQGEEIPLEIIVALQDPAIRKTAHNANFERVCIGTYLGIYMHPAQWRCTMILSGMCGLPFSLDQVAKVLNLEESKMDEGKALIRYFAMPCKPTKTNGQRERNLPEHDVEKWTKFVQYCANDVVVERAISDRLKFFDTPAAEVLNWELDQLINDTGILLDQRFIKNAINMDTIHRDRLTLEAIDITKLDNPNSVAQLKKWLSEETEEEITSLTKATVKALLEGATSGTVQRVLEIRQEMSKTSIKKYYSMLQCVCADGRVRGLLQFYGANRTGRWAGRLIQVQNLTKNKVKDIDTARMLVKRNDLELVDDLYGNVPDILSQLIRTSFVAAPGHRFIIADFSAIEARVIAWLAGEKWRLDVFRTHGKIYEASAAAMFRVPIESVTKTSELRSKAKISELALGYQGGPNALLAMGAIEMGLTEAELPSLVKIWRAANKAIVTLWYRVQETAIKAVRHKTTVSTHGVQFYVRNETLWVVLPSGRKLAYIRPGIREDALFYYGMNQTTKQWTRQDTYGGKLVENIVQAIARDILADSMRRVSDAGYSLVMHVHDEIIAETPNGTGSLEEVCKLMSQPLSWAPDMPLAAEGFETDYYRKD